ncbi:unnamed protein product [Pieris brassicae]|uniref:PX domain-containing protein n=1 Tax=Pieris brassicae TaxID=7116 RepID=A0A9P0TM23_PIEBR|nr:unnamed protein product [Pieris brassicae]
MRIESSIMAAVKKIDNTHTRNQEKRDMINNELSSTSSEENQISVKVYKKRYKDSTSDNEMDRRLQRNHYKSMGNINEGFREGKRNSAEGFREGKGFRGGKRSSISVSNVDLSLHSEEIKKFDRLQIPIVGYEVMEERARFTIYKLKVEDDSRDQSWLVFRRYTDFVRLYNRIRSERPDIILPLPGKRLFRDNFEPAFLEERVRGLQAFINSVLNKLPNDSTVREFFCLDEPPQVFTYQPEVQAVYGALEDSITTLKMQLKQKDATIMHLQKQLAQMEVKVNGCPNCSKVQI